MEAAPPHRLAASSAVLSNQSLYSHKRPSAPRRTTIGNDSIMQCMAYFEAHTSSRAQQQSSEAHG
eukprot:5385256-Prorocentrum_lima.AAC.1